jgi:gas vesicle protein
MRTRDGPIAAFTKLYEKYTDMEKMRQECEAEVENVQRFVQKISRDASDWSSNIADGLDAEVQAHIDRLVKSVQVAGLTEKTDLKSPRGITQSRYFFQNADLIRKYSRGNWRKFRNNVYDNIEQCDLDVSDVENILSRVGLGIRFWSKRFQQYDAYSRAKLFSNPEEARESQTLPGLIEKASNYTSLNRDRIDWKESMLKWKESTRICANNTEILRSRIEWCREGLRTFKKVSSEIEKRIEEFKLALQNTPDMSMMYM